jgi:pyruvate dehydrogenase E1 component alpha subunit
MSFGIPYRRCENFQMGKSQMITDHTKQSLIAFEARVKDLWESGELPSLVHLCGGNEEQLLEIFAGIRPNDWVFLSHRGHYAALLKGMPESELEDFIRTDRSMFCFDRERRIYQSAILGGCIGIATGVAVAIKEGGEDAHVHCFIGDGAADNGHLYEAALYATGHELPITFHIENNFRQVDTDIVVRRGASYAGFSMTAPCIREYSYEPTWPHAGSACKTQITFKRTHPL